MQIFVEYLPLVLFFASFKLYGIYVATGVAIVTSVLTIAYAYSKTKKVNAMQWVSLVIIVVFGGATIFLQDERFIKMKPSVLYVCCAAALAVGKLWFKQDWLAKIFAQAELNVPASVWTTLTWSWVGFFCFLALLNFYVANTYSLDQWVTFKVWGIMGILLVFMVANGLYLTRYMKPGDGKS
jgi:intracellular septation protein